MTPSTPCVESVCEHRGDWPRIAAWVLNCLDRLPPPSGGHLVLYLCYNAADRSHFNSSRRGASLAAELLGVYEREAAACKTEEALGGLNFGGLRFRLEQVAEPPAHLSLFSTGSSGGSPPTQVEFAWREESGTTEPGTIALVRRWTQPLAPQTRLAASLVIESGAECAPHLDRWQGGARWHTQVVYLPPGRTELLVGPSAGCDLLAQGLSLPFALTYEGRADVWEWESAAGPWMPRGSQRGELALAYGDGRGGAAVTLRGTRLPRARTLAEQEAENRPLAFSLEIVGCVLPLPHQDGGYGLVPEDLPAALAPRAVSALQLPGGDWLYLDELREPYLLRVNDAPPGVALLGPGQGRRLTTRPGFDGAHAGEWAEFRGDLRGHFRGELRLAPPVAARLASHAIVEDLPHDIFANYRDRALGRAPVRLESTDGRRYALVFYEWARLPVFVVADGSEHGRRHDPKPDVTVELGAGAEFILGTTHYRLRPIADPSVRYQPAQVSSVSVGG